MEEKIRMEIVDRLKEGDNQRLGKALQELADFYARAKLVTGEEENRKELVDRDQKVYGETDW